MSEYEPVGSQNHNNKPFRVEKHEVMPDVRMEILARRADDSRKCRSKQEINPRIREHALP